MKLYWYPGSCSLAVHIALRECGLAFDMARVDMMTKQLEDGSDYRAINPRGALPALALDDGTVLTQAAALMQVAADLAPQAGLLPAGGVERWRVIEWLNHLASDLHKGFGILFDPAAPDDYKATTRERLRGYLAGIDRALADGEWLANGRFSLADIYAFVISNWAGIVGVDLAGLAALDAFRGRVSARPAVAAALKAEGLA